MSFKETPEQAEIIKSLACTYRLFRRNIMPPEKADAAEIARCVARSGHVCEIIDIASTPLNDQGMPNMNLAVAYAEGVAETFPEALEKALRAAQRADKPLTPAQLAEPPALRAKLAKARQEFYESEENKKGAKALGGGVHSQVKLPE